MSEKFMTTAPYRPDIDGLRALAVISVVGFHALPHSLPGGFIGVDIFFVISGFLISTILLTNLEANTFSFRSFYAKRIKRLFPALSIVLVSCMLFGWVVLFSAEYQQLGKHIAGGASFISNFILWQEAGYFDKAAHYKPLLHLWSLGIEEQFYIVWPLLLWLACKKRLTTLVIITSLIAFSFMLNIKTIRHDEIATFYFPQTRFWELLLGSLLAWVTLYKAQELTSIKLRFHHYLTTLFKQDFFRLSPNLLNHVVALIGFSFILYAHFKVKKTFYFPGFWAILPSVGTVLIIAAGSNAWLNKTVLANRLMVWLGLISFPLYLWHWPILSFLKITELHVSRALALTAVGVAILLAWITYQFVERPIRFNKACKKQTPILLILMSLIGLLGGIIYFKAESLFKAKQTSELIELINNPFPPVNDVDCTTLLPEFKSYAFDAGCKLSKQAMPEIMFIGDSHTRHYYNAIWKQFSDKSILMIAQTSCFPFTGHQFLQGDCKEKFNALLSFLKNNSSIKRVYLSGYWSYLMSGGFSIAKGHWRHAKPVNLVEAKSFKENGRRLLTTILDAKKEVVFLKDIPDLDFDINSCFQVRSVRFSFQPIKTDCWVDFTNYTQRMAPYDAVLTELLSEFPQVKLFDPKPIFCLNNKCYARDAKFPYYVNGDHLNHYGAEQVIKKLREELG
ncbi:acyltransferase family protein [Legionella sp. D16C41]|uniref:acyltransferase family protein n=1 Tax=Legionella sp. D16C41 TaxID=3402688 RepID=UPI003AF7C990